MSQILIVEDEQHLADGLRFNLEAEGYGVRVLETGEAALVQLLETPAAFDVLVLDIMLPGKDGFTVMSELRQAGQFIPTLMLTARGRPDDVLRGFASGADDYLAKPFELAILIARLRGLLRRRDWMQSPSALNNPEPSAPDVFTFGEASEKSVNFDLLELSANGQTIRLTQMEANLLRYLIRHDGKTVSRKTMLQEVWGVHESADTRPIDNFIVRLRRYIEEEPTTPRHLLTVRGIGYRFISIPT